MLHQPTPAFGPPSAPVTNLAGLEAPPFGCRPGEPNQIDPDAYIRDMRGAGAELYPMRGTGYGGMECDGRFGVILSGAGCRGAIDEVEGRYAAIMKIDPYAVGRVAEALFRGEVFARAAATSGGDPAAAHVELTRLRAAAAAAWAEEVRALERFELRRKQEGLNDSGRPSAELRAIEISTGLFAAREAAAAAGAEVIGTEEYALTLPIRSERDALFKLLIAIENEISLSPDLARAREEAATFVADFGLQVAS